MRRTLPGYTAPFELEDFLVVERRRHLAARADRNEMQAEAMVKVRVGEHLAQVAADGTGPVSALDAGVRKAFAALVMIVAWKEFFTRKAPSLRAVPSSGSLP